MTKIEIAGLVIVLWLSAVAQLTAADLKTADLKKADLNAADLNGADLNAADNSVAESKRGLPVLARRVMDISQQAKPGVAIVITDAAVLSRDAVPGVFVVENNEARFRMVRLGKRSAGRVEILSGLFGNEILLIGGLETVHDGSPIKIIK